MITFLQLEYFRKLSEKEHITQTANELCISQTALSSMIIGLEKELGVKLFDRSKRSIQLNEAGKVFLTYVNQVFNTMDNAKAALNDLVDTHDKQVSIAVGSSLVWRPLFHDFIRAFPNYSLKQFNYSTNALTEALQKGTIDFVIAGDGDVVVEEAMSQKIKIDGTFLVVSPNNKKYSSKENVSMEEIKNENFISLPVGQPWRRYCDELFERAGYKVTPVLECDYMMRAPLIESGYGVALTSSSAKEVDLLKPNLYIPISDEYAFREMKLFWNPKRYISKAALDFKKFVINYWK